MGQLEVDVPESEEQLVDIAQRAVSQCRWVVGECASKWTKRYSRGRTDADFGLLVGLSGDQIYQRRRVWESFADVRQEFSALRWSHFYAALTWDDAPECLQWAEEAGATVSEMKAWRRAQRGEDLLSEPEASEDGSPFVGFLSGEPAFVRDPDEFGVRQGDRPRGNRPAGEFDEAPARLTGVARDKEAGDDNYAPFHQGAIQPPAKSAEGTTAVADQVSPEQLAKRISSTLERCARAISAEFVESFTALPDKLKQRLLHSARELAERVAELE